MQCLSTLENPEGRVPREGNEPPGRDAHPTPCGQQKSFFGGVDARQNDLEFRLERSTERGHLLAPIIFRSQDL